MFHAGQIIRNCNRLFAAVIFMTGTIASAAPPALRIVSYNIQSDTEGFTGPRPGLDTVLKGIGEQNQNGVWQPLDILALQETTSNAATLAPIVTALNNYYGAGTYAYPSYQGTQNGGNDSGNGPNALLYNTTTLQIVLQNGAQAIGVSGTPNSNGINRQVVRYAFQPIGGTVEDRFYIYVSHMKSSASGVDSVNRTYRNREAQAIRTDAASLPATARMLYVGDFNMSDASEAAYATLTAAGTGQAIDPVTWSSPAPLTSLSWSSTGIRYRDDIQFMTANLVSQLPTAGLRYITGSFRVFGNNGSVSFGNSVNSQSNSALNNLQGPISASSVRSALTTASDHLPIVADFLVITPYEAWREQKFSAAELNDPTISGDAIDRDRDGISNLQEYALALDPNVPDAGGLPTPGQIAVSSSNYLTLTYTKPKVSSDLSYVVQVSSDLGTWLSGSNYTTTVSTTDNADGITQTVVVRDRTAMASESHRWIRLGVTRN